MRTGALRHPRRSSMAEKVLVGSVRNEIRSSSVGSASVNSSSMSSTSSFDHDSNSNARIIQLPKPPTSINKRKTFSRNPNNLADFSQSFPGFSSYLKACPETADSPKLRDERRTEGGTDERRDTRYQLADTITKEVAYIPFEKCSYKIHEKHSTLQRSTTMPLYQASDELKSSLKSQKRSLPLTFESSVNEPSIKDTEKSEFIDRYDAITNIKVHPGHGYTGWSTTVMGTGPFGWSDDLLNGYSGSQVGRNMKFKKLLDSV